MTQFPKWLYSVLSLLAPASFGGSGNAEQTNNDINNNDVITRTAAISANVKANAIAYVKESHFSAALAINAGKILNLPKANEYAYPSNDGFIFWVWEIKSNLPMSVDDLFR